jgi:serine/threonine protein kinase
MTDSALPPNPAPSPTGRDRVDGLCDAFEKAWQQAAESGPMPSLEEYVAQAEPADRTAALKELLYLDLQYRHSQNRTRPEAEYLAQYTEYQLLIEEVIRTATSSLSPSPNDAIPAGHDVTTAGYQRNSNFGESTTYAAGQQVDRYTIRKYLGGGGFGEVYLAEDPLLARHVAVKIPKPAILENRALLDNLLQEARTVAALNFPGVVSVHDVGCDEAGRPFVVMDYIKGLSLRELMDAGALPPQRTAEILAEVAATMARAHRRGFVHRDLKPGNIMLDPEGRPHVLDFGLALHEDSRRDAGGECAGTIPYMAPEQISGAVQGCDGRTDIWAIGVLLYEMLTKRKPFPGRSVNDVIPAILGHDPKPPRQIDETIPQELETICLKCLHKSVGDRYTTAHDLARDLRQWRRPKKWLPRGILAAGLGFAFLCIGFWLSGGGGEKIDSALPEPLQGQIDILLWNPENPSRRGLSVTDLRAAPLRANDQIRVHAELNKPAYLYLLWIDSRGQVQPVFPWTPGRWETLAGKETPILRVNLPPEVDRGWPLAGPAGMETLMLLARETPIPPTLDLKSSLADLPRQTMQDAQAIVWFSDGNPVTVAMNKTRGPQFFDPQQIQDPVLITQRHIQERLGRYFPVIRAVSVASQGKEQ